MKKSLERVTQEMNNGIDEICAALRNEGRIHAKRLRIMHETPPRDIDLVAVDLAAVANVINVAIKTVDAIDVWEEEMVDIVGRKPETSGCTKPLRDALAAMKGDGT